MTEQDYVNELSRRFRDSDEATADIMRLADEAVAALPHSARLWCMRGDLIQVGTEEVRHTLDDARASYERALVLEPDNAEALECMGHFFDAIVPDSSKAEWYFLRSIDHGASKEAFVSLAELYLASGRATEALAILQPERCPYHSDPEIDVVAHEVAEAIATRGA